MERIQIHLLEDELAELCRVAERSGRSVSSLVRQAVREQWFPGMKRVDPVLGQIKLDERGDPYAEVGSVRVVLVTADTTLDEMIEKARPVVADLERIMEATATSVIGFLGSGRTASLDDPHVPRTEAQFRERMRLEAIGVDRLHVTLWYDCADGSWNDGSIIVYLSPEGEPVDAEVDAPASPRT